MKTIYKSKIGWWVYAVIAVTIAICMAGPIFYGDILEGVILALGFTLFEIGCFVSVRYCIDDHRLGVRSFFRWTWYPIDKIESISESWSVNSSAALSFDRISIRFTDKNILKSTMPLEISPEDRDNFIARLKSVNPDIQTKS